MDYNEEGFMHLTTEVVHNCPKANGCIRFMSHMLVHAHKHIIMDVGKTLGSYFLIPSFIQPTHIIMVRWVKQIQTELMVKAYSNCLVRAIGKALPMQFS